MNHLKMLGLAAVAATGLMAFLGTGTASATVLCETNVSSGCTSAWDVTNGTTLLFTGEGSTTVTGPFGEVIDTCTGGTTEGNTSSTGSSTTTVTRNSTKVEFTGCTKTTTVVSGGSLEIHNVSGTKNGTVTSSGLTFIVHNTPLGACQFETRSTDMGTLTGKDNTATGKPTLDQGADNAAMIPSENCHITGIMEGSYEYTGTTPFNVAES
jgi:hypothetical protein